MLCKLPSPKKTSAVKRKINGDLGGLGLSLLSATESLYFNFSSLTFCYYVMVKVILKCEWDYVTLKPFYGFTTCSGPSLKSQILTEA
jgi:hypothetical protein